MSEGKEDRSGAVDAHAVPTTAAGDAAVVADVLDSYDKKKFSWFHVKVIIISGMGFFTDSYDLFSISLLTKILGRIYYQDNPFVTESLVNPGNLPINSNAAVSAVALVGTLCGQLIVGHIGDRFGRKRVYGMALAIMIFGALCQAFSFGSTPQAVIGTLCFWRFILGLGIGGDYPLSATIMSEFSSTRSRGAYVGSVFAMQGIGILVAAAITTIVAASFDAAYPSEAFPTAVPGCYSWSKLTSTSASGTCPLANQQAYYDQVLASTPPEMDFVWRIVLAFGAFPAACTMYFRSRMHETPRYVARVVHDAQRALRDAQAEEIVMTASNNNDNAASSEITTTEAAGHQPDTQHDLASFLAFLSKHKYELMGCAVCWFCLDIAFYSQNLFQKEVFLQSGFLPPANSMTGIEETAKIARAQAIIALGSTIPGYWFTVFFVDRWGRKPIQIMGFLLMTTFMAALAGSYQHLLNPNNHTNTALSDLQPNALNGWITMYALCFFFANFGPNTTTFIIPSELFPTKWRSTGHGMAAACGKLGAIVGGFGFLYASQPAPGETTFAYPCNSNYPSDLSSSGACVIKNDCPSGRTTPSGAGLGAQCSVCIPNVLSGCYPFGIGLSNTLAILAAINFVGLLFTFLIPETKGATLEQLNGETDDLSTAEKKKANLDGYDKIEQQLDMVAVNQN